jgi:hypothetical protein
MNTALRICPARLVSRGVRDEILNAAFIRRRQAFAQRAMWAKGFSFVLF